MTEFLRTGDILGLPLFRLYLADSLARRFFPDGGETAEGIRWLVLHAAVQAGNGHMRTDLNALETEMAEWHVPPENADSGPGFRAERPSELAAVLPDLLEKAVACGLVGRLESDGSPADSRPVPRPPMVITPDGSFLYFLRRRREEDRLLAALAERAVPGGGGAFPVPGELPDEPAGELMGLLSGGRRLAVLAGGPGTGKTTTVARLLDLVDAGRRGAGLPPAAVALAAPTGRAAARMSESLNTAAAGISAAGRTLHGLLGLVPGRPPVHHRDTPLDADLVVVDEASMVDLPMMNRLLDALSPETPLLLVGDPDQLPSVEAGALLGDLLAGESAAAGAGPLAGAVVRLTRVYRSATAILDAAAAVRDGDGPALRAAFREDGVRFREPLAPEKTARRIAEGYRPAVQAASAAADTGFDDLFAAYGARAVLTPLRRGPRGVEFLNEAVSRILGGTSGAFSGMWIMVNRNDTARNLWNGDRGIILERDGRLRAVFPGTEGYREFPLAALPGWEPAWVQTVHKSQGSEFEEVTVLLPRGAERLMTREILYTAFTRARSTVDLFAEDETVDSALERRVFRNSRIRNWAAGA